MCAKAAIPDTKRGRGHKSKHRQRAEQLLAEGVSEGDVRATLLKEFSLTKAVLNYCIYEARGATLAADGTRKLVHDVGHPLPAGTAMAEAGAPVARGLAGVRKRARSTAAEAVAEACMPDAHGAAAGSADTSATPRLPVCGERVLVLKPQYLDRLLSGEKTLEIRGKALTPGIAWLGAAGMIHGMASLEAARLIDSTHMWQELRSQHCVPGDDLPYKRTWALPIMAVQRLHQPVPYVHPRGAIGVVTYRGPAAVRSLPLEAQQAVEEAD